MDGFSLVFTPGAGDVVLFSVGPGSTIIGTIDPCGSGLGIGEGTILTEGTGVEFPGLACVVAPASSDDLWDGFFCGPSPVTGGGDDNTDALDIFPPARLPPTPTGGVTATPVFPTLTPTPTGATVTPAFILKDTVKCQHAIGTAVHKFLLTKEKQTLKGQGPGSGNDKVGSSTCPDLGGTPGLAAAKAESKKIAKICKKCGGPSKTTSTWMLN